MYRKFTKFLQFQKMTVAIIFTLTEIVVRFQRWKEILKDICDEGSLRFGKLKANVYIVWVNIYKEFNNK